MECRCCGRGWQTESSVHATRGWAISHKYTRNMGTHCRLFECHRKQHRRHRNDGELSSQKQASEPAVFMTVDAIFRSPGCLSRLTHHARKIMTKHTAESSNALIISSPQKHTPTAHHAGAAPSAVCSPSECCSRSMSARPLAAYLRR